MILLVVIEVEVVGVLSLGGRISVPDSVRVSLSPESVSSVSRLLVNGVFPWICCTVRNSIFDHTEVKCISRVCRLLIHRVLPWFCRIILWVDRLNRLGYLWFLPIDPIAVMDLVSLGIGRLDRVDRLLDLPVSVGRQRIG